MGIRGRFGDLLLVALILALSAGLWWAWRQVLQAEADRVADLAGQAEERLAAPPASAPRAGLAAALDAVGRQYAYTDSVGGKLLVEIHRERLQRLAAGIMDPASAASATEVAAAVRLRDTLAASW